MTFGPLHSNIARFSFTRPATSAFHTQSARRATPLHSETRSNSLEHTFSPANLEPTLGRFPPRSSTCNREKIHAPHKKNFDISFIQSLHTDFYPISQIIEKNFIIKCMNSFIPLGRYMKTICTFENETQKKLAIQKFERRIVR